MLSPDSESATIVEDSDAAFALLDLLESLLIDASGDRSADTVTETAA
jgi:hypothetical protein